MLGIYLNTIFHEKQTLISIKVNSIFTTLRFSLKKKMLSNKSSMQNINCKKKNTNISERVLTVNFQQLNM